jgi:hypothetical protein
MSWKLDENSPRVNQPDDFVGKLYNHQLAMLRKALEIENSNTQFGFLSDRPGSGKTNVIISLVLTDIQRGLTDRQTLLIVPQNIISQWKEQIALFSGNKIKVKELVYNDIINIESHGSLISLREYNILITTNSLFETIMTSLSANGNTLYRIVYDEIDTMDEQISSLEIKKKTIQMAKEQLMEDNKRKQIKETINFIPPIIDKGLKNKITWFVSASIYNMIDPKHGFYFLGKQIPNNELPNLFIKCGEKFIQNSLPFLEEEEEEIYECSCIADKYAHLLSIDQLDAINSLSYDEVKLKNRKKVPADELELLKMLVKQYYTEMDDILEAIDTIERKMKSFNIGETEIDHPLMKQIMKKEKEYTFAETLAKEFHKVGCSDKECKEMELCTYNAFETYQKQIYNNMKLPIINDLLIDCKKEGKSQILIFSDFQGSFKYMPALIGKLGMTYEDLCKGTAKGINDAIVKYKNGETEILFIQSRTDGCGLNLQNTTHLIFIHRTDDRLKEQIIGRAQRSPRTGVLKIIALYNTNEILDEDE